jgi:hypothetical protein
LVILLAIVLKKSKESLKSLVSGKTAATTRFLEVKVGKHVKKDFAKILHVAGLSSLTGQVLIVRIRP